LDVRDAILEEFDGICRRLGVSYVLYAGTLLGIVRDGCHLPEEEPDVDVMLIQTNRYRDLENELVKAGYTAGMSYATNGHFRKGGVLLDVYMSHTDQHRINVEPYLKTLGSIKHNGRIYLTPFPVDKFLEAKYGKSWRTRQKGRKSPD